MITSIFVFKDNIRGDPVIALAFLNFDESRWCLNNQIADRQNRWAFGLGIRSMDARPPEGWNVRKRSKQNESMILGFNGMNATDQIVWRMYGSNGADANGLQLNQTGWTERIRLNFERVSEEMNGLPRFGANQV